MSLVAAHLEQFTNRYPSLKAASIWGLAVSGGADSTALAVAAAELGRPVVLLHVNYGLRGAESDADEAFVRSLGAPVEVLRPRVESGSEEQLREIRYSWFQSFAFPVLTAHTQDDQAETVLHRLLRGSGPGGLAGILETRSAQIFRPFLELPRRALREYLRNRQQSWREDSSNANLAFRRNYLRHVLLPQIEEHINPAAPQALARLAQLAADEEVWLQGLTSDLLPHFARQEDKAWILDAKHLREAPRALQRRLVRQLVCQIQREEALGFEHVEAVLELCESPEGSARIQVPGLDVMRSFDEVRILPQTELPGGDRNFRLALEIPGRTPLGSCAGSIQTTLLPRGVGDLPATRDKITPYNEIGLGLDWESLESAQIAGHPLELRNWRPGDEYQRPGRDRPEKLKELFQKFRIPLWQRRCWPIVVLKDEPVWARTFGPAAAFVATAETKTALHIEFVPHPTPEN